MPRTSKEASPVASAVEELLRAVTGLVGSVEIRPVVSSVCKFIRLPEADEKDTGPVGLQVLEGAVERKHVEALAVPPGSGRILPEVPDKKLGCGGGGADQAVECGNHGEPGAGCIEDP